MRQHHIAQGFGLLEGSRAHWYCRRSGEIAALFGVNCHSGDTFTTGTRCSLTSMFVPPAVVSLAINMSKVRPLPEVLPQPPRALLKRPSAGWRQERQVVDRAQQVPEGGSDIQGRVRPRERRGEPRAFASGRLQSGLTSWAIFCRR